VVLDLPIDIQAALGRLVWRAIFAEDRLYQVGARLLPNAHRLPAGQVIGNCIATLTRVPASEEIDDALAWLTDLERGLEMRNELLHAAPVALVELDANGRPLGERPGLVHFPRSGGPGVSSVLDRKALDSIGKLLENAVDRYPFIIVRLSTYLTGLGAPNSRGLSKLVRRGNA
jgi:hypothetical protein